MADPSESIDVGDLRLQRWRPGEVDDLLPALVASWQHLRPWMAWADERPTRESAQGFLDHCEQTWADGSSYEYAIRDIGSGEVLGAIGMMRRIGEGGLEIGYWVRVDRTRRRIATTAAGAMTETGFAVDGVDRLEIHCDAANAASAAVAAHLGYQLIEVAPRPVVAPAESGQGMLWRRLS
jgi:RimJ/RimL family protein N-acetyltransferase